MRARFGDIDVARPRESLEARLEPQDTARLDDVIRPVKQLDNAKYDVISAQQHEAAAKQGLTFGIY